MVDACTVLQHTSMTAGVVIASTLLHSSMVAGMVIPGNVLMIAGIVIAGAVLLQSWQLEW